MFETMMLGLRTMQGVSEEHFRRLHGTELYEKYGDQLDQLEKEGLGGWYSERTGGRRFALTARGVEVQNDVLMRLMD